VITVNIEKKNGIIMGILSCGHAEKKNLLKKIFRGAALYNAVCAGVSALEYAFLNTVRELTRVVIYPQITCGRFEITLHEYSREDAEVLKNLSAFFLIGLSAISGKHPEQLQIIIKEAE